VKFASYVHKGKTTFGIVMGDRIADLGGEAADLKAFLTLEPAQRAAITAKAKASVSISEIEYLPVIPNPGKIFCVGLNYQEHVQESKRPEATHPAIFLRFADSLLAHDKPLHLSRVTDVLDYEGELAVIIGKGGRYIAESEAMSHVAGYACFNDGTFRDWQYHTHQFTPGKNFPGSGGFGPWMTTPDEVADIKACRLQTRLNGEVMQSALIAQMIFSIERVIAYLSGFSPLSPGDVIATGTPGGVGFRREPKVLMRAGDVAEVEIDGVGLLRNPIGAPV